MQVGHPTLPLLPPAPLQSLAGTDNVLGSTNPYVEFILNDCDKLRRAGGLGFVGVCVCLWMRGGVWALMGVGHIGG